VSTSTWNSSASGDWSDAADWTGGVPNSATANATIVESGTYTIDIASSETFAVGSVTLNDANATLEIDGALNLTDTLNITSGDLLLTGKINGGTIDTGGGTFTSSGGTLDGVTVDGTIATGSENPALTISGGLTMAGAGGTGAGQISMSGGELDLSGSETISNVNISMNGGDIVPTYGGTVTLASSVTINDASTTAAFLGSYGINGAGDGTIVSNATINISTTNGVFVIDPTNFTNAGTITVGNTDLLQIDTGTFSNTGTIVDDGGVAFFSEVTTAELGNLTFASGASLGLYGSLNNTGATFVIPSGATLWGTIEGGTIKGAIELTAQDQTLTLTGNPVLENTNGSEPYTIDITGQDATLQFAGPETINNVQISLRSSGSSIVSLSGTVTFGPSVSITQSGADAFFGTTPYGGSDGTIISDASITADVKGGSFTIGATEFTNAGKITVSGEDLVIQSTTFDNSGSISIDGTSTLDFASKVSLAELSGISIASGATLDFTGTLENAGETFNVPSGLTIGGTIAGGTIVGTIDVGAAVPLILEGSPVLLGAGGTGVFDINEAAGAVVEIGDTETIANASISLANNADFESLYLNTATIAATTIISNSGSGSAFIGTDPGKGAEAGSLVNDGTIDAGADGGTLDIGGEGTFTNAGTISVTNGDTVIFAGEFGITNTGTIRVDGTSTLEFQTSTTTAQLGIISAASGATLDFVSLLDNTGVTFDVPTGTNVDGTIDGGTIHGDFNVTNAQNALFLFGTMTISNATIKVGSTSSTGAAIVNLDGGVVTLASTVTIESLAGTAGYLGTDAYVPQDVSAGTIVNDGTIIAGTSGSALGVDPATFTNAGLVEAANGGGLVLGLLTNLSGTTLTGGSYESSGSSTFEFVNFTTITTDDATIILNGASSVMEQLNPDTKDTVTVDSTLTAVGAGGALEILGGRNWTSATAFSNAGTIELGGDTFKASGLTNSGTLSGYGTVSTSITNSGTVEAQGGTLTMGGTLSDISGTTLTAGTLGAGAGATLQLGSNISIVTADGTILLSGANALIESLHGGTEVNIQSTLTTIGASGGLEVLSGGNYTTGNAIADDGTITLGGGSFQSRTLTIGSGAKLAGFGTVASVIVDSGSVSASGGALVFTASGDTFAGALGGSEVDFGGGSDTLQSSASLTAATIGVYGNANVSLATSQTIGGALNLGSGTIDIGANTLTLSGAGSTLAGTISGTGSLAFSGGRQTLNSGAVLSISNWTLSGGDTTNIDAAMSYGGSLSAGAGTTLNVNSADTLTLTSTASFAGTVAGAGTLAVAGGTQSFNAGTALKVSNIALSDSDTANIDTSLRYAGSLSAGAGTTLNASSGDTLTLAGAASFAGTVAGTGTLALAGGTQSFNAGAALSVSNVALLGSDTANMNESLGFGGKFSAGASTNLEIASGDTFMLSGAVTLAGTVGGGGTLFFSHGSEVIDSGAALNVAQWQIGGTASASVNESLGYAGNFLEWKETTLAIAATDQLSLTGSANLAGSLLGAGTLALSNATLNGLVIGGSVTLEDGGTVHETGIVTVGGITSAAATLAIAAGASYRIDGNVNIAQGASASSAIDDNGLLIKDAGTGTSKIDVAVVDDGSIEAASGTLELAKAVSGTGSMTVDANATLEIAAGGSAASGLQMIFNGTDATLALGKGVAFGATIEGFVAGDTIDLLRTKATTATLESGDQLVVQNGKTTVVTLQLTGDYIGYTFSVTSDGHDGQEITATAPAAAHLAFAQDGESFVSTGQTTEIAILAGSHGDSFDFNAHFGQVRIEGYQPGSDMLDFSTATFASASALEAHATQDALGNTVIALDAGDTITLAGVSLTRFEAHVSDWHFI
jgi:fibronectin-binding autotransporter adhesin